MVRRAWPIRPAGSNVDGGGGGGGAKQLSHFPSPLLSMAISVSLLFLFI